LRLASSDWPLADVNYWNSAGGFVVPCNVTANLIELLADGSVKISGTCTGGQFIQITIVNLTITKLATRSGPSWSVTYSGTEITGDLTQFRNAFCDEPAPAASATPGSPRSIGWSGLVLADARVSETCRQ